MNLFVKVDKKITKINIEVISVDNDWFRVAKAPVLSNFFLLIKIGKYEQVLDTIVLHRV